MSRDDDVSLRFSLGNLYLFWEEERRVYHVEGFVYCTGDHYNGPDFIMVLDGTGKRLQGRLDEGRTIPFPVLRSSKTYPKEKPLVRFSTLWKNTNLYR